MKPFPGELVTMEACRTCNSSFSQDEQYFSALLAAVLTGSTDPDQQSTPEAARRFEQNPALRDRIEKSCSIGRNLFGEVETLFCPEIDRVNRVVVKNARGHALYELDIWVSDATSSVAAVPVHKLVKEQRNRFVIPPRDSLNSTFESLVPSGWPEIGTRQFIRRCLSLDSGYRDIRGGWVVVQDGIYRFRVEEEEGGISVKSVIHEYLVTEVIWNAEYVRKCLTNGPAA